MHMQDNPDGRVVKVLAWAIVVASLGLYAIEAWTLASAIFGGAHP